MHKIIALRDIHAQRGALKRDHRMFRMLLVEDNSDFRQEISGILRTNFPLIDIIEVGNGEEVWREIDGVHPNLIIMDVKLPGANGLTLTKEIKARYANLPVVILSSHDLPEYRRVALAYGASSYIAKGSSSIDELLALIEDSLLTP